MIGYPNGIKFPFRVQPAGGIGLVSGADKISSNLSALVLSFVNERLIYKSVGTISYMAILRNANMVGLVRSLVTEAIIAYEKRATRLSVQVYPKEVDGKRHVLADVSFAFSLSGEPRNISIQLI
jgi:hypothetical protein